MPAINSRSERGSVQLAELSLLLAAVRGPPNPRAACQKVERSRLESLFHRRGTGSSNPSPSSGESIANLNSSPRHERIELGIIDSARLRLPAHSWPPGKRH
jgi:hypothetical protein